MPAHGKAHQHRHQGDGQRRSGRHRIGFGERQRTEQAPLLRFESEHRCKRQGDDQQTPEQGGADLDGGVLDQAQALDLIDLCMRMRVLPLLESAMGVLDHHDGGIDHRADRDRDAAQGHDVGVDAAALHDDEGAQHAQWQGH